MSPAQCGSVLAMQFSAFDLMCIATALVHHGTNYTLTCEWCARIKETVLCKFRNCSKLFSHEPNYCNCNCNTNLKLDMDQSTFDWWMMTRGLIKIITMFTKIQMMMMVVVVEQVHPSGLILLLGGSNCNASDKISPQHPPPPHPHISPANCDRSPHPHNFPHSRPNPILDLTSCCCTFICKFIHVWSGKKDRCLILILKS